ncbi:MAG: TRAM domain-containing protein [Actinomycetota bacterium]|nr:TRAM domain-containing protein [Actinomycetota bacterium]
MEHGPSDTFVADPALVELPVGDVAAGGGCVGRAPDGRVAFVRYAAPGERVRARVTEERAHFLRADAVEILDASSGRVVPACPHAGPGRCGGCDWQHLDLALQRRLKAQLVATQLGRVAGIDRHLVVEELPGAPDGLGWRTRVRFAVAPDGRIGLRRHRSHGIEPAADCPLAVASLRAAATVLPRWKGAREVEITALGADSVPLIAVSTLSGANRRPTTVPALPVELAGAGLVVDGRSLAGPGHVVAEVRHRRFRVSYGSFWQVHVAAPLTLIDAVIAALEPREDERVVDLYAGVGLFAGFLAEAVGARGSVLAIEQDRRAASDARANLADLANVVVRSRRVDAALVARELEGADLVVLDPPRQGAGVATMEALCALDAPPRRVAYVACDPASFARDARVLLEAGWQLGTLRAFDLFPMTEHVELVAAFERPAPPGQRVHLPASHLPAYE